MNRQSSPVEIVAPDLNREGLHVFCGCDSCISRCLGNLSFRYPLLADDKELAPYFVEQDNYINSGKLYLLTKDVIKTIDIVDTPNGLFTAEVNLPIFISHAFALERSGKPKLYPFNCTDQEAIEFKKVVEADIQTQYPEVS
jgi:hypothetical protein